MSDPVRLEAAAHGILKDQVDPDALDVTRRLSEAGYQALLVGGCVRDLLLGAQPKDFDVATDATPEEVRQLFEQHGTVHAVDLVQDRETGRPRGFGFVEMDDDAAGAAIEALDGTDLGGRNLRVNEARPRADRGGRREW